MLRLPRLKPTVDVRTLADGRLFVLRSDLDADYELGGDPQWVAALLALLDGSREVTEITGAMAEQRLPGKQSDIEAAIAELASAGLVDDAAEEQRLCPSYRERFARQLAFLSDVAGKDAVSAQERLRDARVTLLGAGGLGSWAAYGIVCAGVGELRVVDGDRVESSNLNRQILYSEADLGSAKASTAADRLKAFSSHTLITAIDERMSGTDAIADAIRGSDLVIDAIDQPPQLIDRWVNEACVQERVPYLAISQQPPKIRIGPLFEPGKSGCYGCLEDEYRDRFPLYDELAAAAPAVSPAATFGPACGAVGALAASEAVAYLSGIWDPATAATAWIFDLRTFALESETVQRRADCTVCRELASPNTPSDSRA